MYILDTNVISALRRPERAPSVVRWIKAKPEDQLFLSSITIGEIERGIALQSGRNADFARDLRDWMDRTGLLFADRIVPFDAGAARIWGRLCAQLGHSGADLMIAATALDRGATIVTGNVTDFVPTGVPVENPFE